MQSFKCLIRKDETIIPEHAGQPERVISAPPAELWAAIITRGESLHVLRADSVKSVTRKVFEYLQTLEENGVTL